ncbi:hypothetical protein BY458DRAFT_499922 [Sporodiniella umbellata]|nr:hypothetical protein BY458DRAFT_499922 [Sporodiniella umbellata]
MAYHPSSKASSVTSISSNTSSVWGSLPSLSTDRAESISSEIEELPEPTKTFSAGWIKKYEDDSHAKLLLSEEQKRVNHIASEKRRRHTIQGGFCELNALVPTLKNTNNAKSVILFKSVEYAKRLERRNQQLADQLLQLKRKVEQRQLKKRYRSISIPNEDPLIDLWLLQSNTSLPALNIPTMDDEGHCVTYGRERLLSSGKLNHLK